MNIKIVDTPPTTIPFGNLNKKEIFLANGGFVYMKIDNGVDEFHGKFNAYILSGPNENVPKDQCLVYFQPLDKVIRCDYELTIWKK